MKNFTRFLLAGTLPFMALAASAAIPSTFTVTPAPGSSVSEIKEITVEVDSYYDVYAASYSQSFTINGVSYGKNDITTGWFNDNGFKFTLKEAITAPGDYVINFPSGFFYDDWDNTVGGEVEWTVTIEGEAAPEVPETSIPSYFTVSPAADATVAELKTISVTYTGRDELIAGFYSKVFTIDGQEYSYRNGDYSFKYEGMFEETFTITLNTPIKTNGVHVISFPKGYFYLDAGILSDLDGLTWAVTVDAEEGGETPEPEEPETPDVPVANIPADFTVTPAAGSTVTELKDITVQYGKNYELYIGFYTKTFTIDGKEYSNRNGDYTFEFIGMYENGVTISLNEPITSAGTHTISFPAGFFYTDYDDFAEFVWSVNIEGEEEDDDDAEFEAIENHNVIIDPEQGVYSSLSEFHLIFLSTNYYPETNALYPIYLKNEKTGETVAKLRGQDGGAATDIYLILPERITEKGHYILDIPEGAIYDALDNDLPAMQFRFWVDGSGTSETPQETVYTDPADGSTVTSLSTILIGFPDMTEVYANGSEKDNVVVTRNGETVETTVSYSFDSSIDDSEIYMSFSPALTEAGNYEIYVPAYVFNLGITQFDTRWNKEFTLHYTVTPESGIDNIKLADEAAEIYTLEGIRVSDMKAGHIYIVRKGGSVSKVLAK